jgi:integrase
MAKNGRFKIDRDSFLEAVRKTKSLSDSVLSLEFGVVRKTVWSYKKNNPKVLEEAEEILEGLGDREISPKKMGREAFMKIPVIQELIAQNRKRDVGKTKLRAKLGALYHVCVHFNLHPDKITLERVADLYTEMKLRAINDDIVPEGLAYSTIREGWRDYFINIRGIPKIQVTNAGMDAKPTLGYGSHSKELITKDERRIFETELKEVCREMNLSYRHYSELITDAKLMFHSGTRRDAMATYNFKLHEYQLNKDVWILGIIDKGRKRIKVKNGKFVKGLKWDKPFTGEALEILKHYIVERFGIEMDKQEIEVPRKIEWLFPILRKSTERITEIFGKVFERIGKQTSIPVHIFRHTFAQDTLKATDHNFELVATLGGWKSTKILKDAYGEMSLEAKIRALRRIQGLPVEDVTYLLKW